MRGVFPYYGGKANLGKKIISFFPEHKTFVDAYGGAGHVIMQKPPSQIDVWNDLDKKVYHFFKILRERPDDLLAAIELTPFHRQEFVDSLEDSEDPIEQARRVFIMHTQGWSGRTAMTPGHFGYAVEKSARNMSGKVSQYLSQIKNLYEVAERIRTIQIENLPAIRCIEKYDRPTTLFYLDPPYLASTRTAQNIYDLEMTESDHVELAGVLKNIKGKAVISAYPSDLYEDLYKDWQKYELKNVPVSAHNKKTDNPSRRVEVIWMNY